MEAGAGTGTGGPAVAGRRSHDGGDHDQARRWDQGGAVAGLVFIGLILISFFTPDTPGIDSSAEELAAGLTAERSGHQISLLVGFLGDIAFLVFVAGLWSRLRREEGLGGMWAGLFILAAAVFSAVILVTSGLYLALVQAGATADTSVLPALAVLDYWVGIAVVPPAVAMMLGVAAAILSTRALPAWLGWLAAVDGVVLALSLGAVFETDEETVLVGIGGFGGFLLFLVWTLATSIVLLMKAGRDDSTAPREPGAAAQAA